MKAMILAAGRGKRMGNLTQTCPKPLLKVKGRCLLDWHLSKLSAAGFKDVVINDKFKKLYKIINNFYCIRFFIHI